MEFLPLTFHGNVNLFPIRRLDLLLHARVGIGLKTIDRNDLVARPEACPPCRQTRFNLGDDGGLIGVDADIADLVLFRGLRRDFQLDLTAVTQHVNGDSLAGGGQDLGHKVFPLGIPNPIQPKDEVSGHQSRLSGGGAWLESAHARRLLFVGGLLEVIPVKACQHRQGHRNIHGRSHGNHDKALPPWFAQELARIVVGGCRSGA